MLCKQEKGNYKKNKQAIKYLSVLILTSMCEKFGDLFFDPIMGKKYIGAPFSEQFEGFKSIGHNFLIIT